MYRRIRQRVSDYVHSVRAAVDPPKERMIVEFNTADAINRFQVTTDQVLGGRTTATFELKALSSLHAGLFQGIIVPPDYGGRANRGGFASFRTLPSEPVWDLEQYSGIEMRVKTDGRPYIFNVKCKDHSPEDLFQGRILVPPFKWITIALKFSDFVLTSRGTVQLLQQPVSSGTINGFGFLIADGQPGPFRFEVQYIKAMLQLPTENFMKVLPGKDTPQLQALVTSGKPAPGTSPIPSTTFVNMKTTAERGEGSAIPHEGEMLGFEDEEDDDNRARKRAGKNRTPAQPVNKNTEK